MEFFKLLKVDSQKITSAEKNLFLNPPQILWDTVDTVNIPSIRSRCAKVEAKCQFLEENPKHLSKQFLKSYIIGIIGTSIGLSLFIFGVGDNLGIFLIILSWIYTGFLYKEIKKLTVDIIKLQIAKQKNWIYNPDEDYSKWKKLSQVYPELFDMGNEKQYIEDQFWGDINYKNKVFYFHSGLYSYDVVTRDSKGRRHSTTYKKHFFNIYVSKSINCKFILTPENMFDKIGNMFSKKEINTESNRFNKTFAFSYRGPKEEQSQHIVKVLTPAVQEKLLSIHDRKKNPQILFNDNVISFMFDGTLFKKLHTNFKKSLDLDQRDVDFLTHELEDILDITTEMVQYLD